MIMIWLLLFWAKKTNPHIRNFQRFPLRVSRYLGVLYHGWSSLTYVKKSDSWILINKYYIKLKLFTLKKIFEYLIVTEYHLNSTHWTTTKNNHFQQKTKWPASKSHFKHATYWSSCFHSANQLIRPTEALGEKTVRCTVGFRQFFDSWPFLMGLLDAEDDQSMKRKFKSSSKMFSRIC